MSHEYAQLSITDATTFEVVYEESWMVDCPVDHIRGFVYGWASANGMRAISTELQGIPVSKVGFDMESADGNVAFRAVIEYHRDGDSDTYLGER